MKIPNSPAVAGSRRPLDVFDTEARDKSQIPNDGFTLAEMVIAAGVLVTITGIVLGIYVPTIRAQRKSIDFARIQQESQIVLEIMAKDIRNGQIDYVFNGYSSPLNMDGEAVLALKNVNGDTYVVYCLDSAQVLVHRDSVPVDCTGATPISASDITVTDLDFYIKPGADPFIPGASLPRQQPRVTIVLRAQRPVSVQPVSVHLQTTIPQRFTEKQ